jgi:bleomycin hydrolase
MPDRKAISMTTTPTAPVMTEPTAMPTVFADEAAAISPDALADLRRAFEANSAYRVAQNAVTKTPVTDVALNRSVVTGIDHTFSNLLDDWEVTNQKKSGRCWMFAALNLLRVGAMKKMNLKEFEFSQNHTLFRDKFERANYFLEAIIETADRPVDDRTVAWLLSRPVDDGGQWNMFVNIVRKHGVVPKSVMPETQSSSETPQMNAILLSKLREGAKTLRDLRSSGAPMEAARAAKREILAVIHRILCIHLGTPPERFDWQWNDKDREFHRDGEMTPKQFAETYITLPIDEYVCLVHDPRASSPFGRTFTVQYLGNVVGGEIVKYLNVEIDLMKDLAMQAVTNGEPVWFGCDVGKMMQRDLGLWDRNLYDYRTLYDTTFDLDKEARLNYHETFMTHAMLFTGVDVVDGSPRRWRVENSWGDENGKKGFYAMNDSWFDEYMFEIAARKSALPQELVAALDTDPIVLPPWDPMGALAR